MKFNIWFSFLIFIYSLSASAQIDTESIKQLCSDKKIESLPILQGGRTKPLYVHSKEMVQYLTNKSKVQNHSAVEAYCLLSFSNQIPGIENELIFNIPVEHVDLKKFFNTQESKLPMALINSQLESLQKEMMKNKENTSYSKSIQRLIGQIRLYQNIKDGMNWMIFSNNDWIQLTQFIKNENFNSLTQVVESNDVYLKNHSDHHILELKYNKLRPFFWSIFLSLITIFILVLNRNSTIYLSAVGLLILVQLIGIIMRVFISGRAPITNMYETVMFSGFGALILAGIMFAIRKDKFFLIAAVAYNTLTLFMMNFAPSMLNEAISPLVPVLRDNFWLSTHVTTVILSYAAFAISWILANLVLFRRSFTGITDKDLRYFGDLTYTCLKFGTVLLAAGIILGGVWADYSWGRYWGWDPKETWSLIVLCVYMAILHGRYTNWINPKRFIALTAGAFLSVMMAWFGVNYILASGLHSYGFSEGGAVFLGSFFLIQIIFLVITHLKTARNT